MFSLLIENSKALTYAGIAFAFIVTFILTGALKGILPTDLGREFAVDGAKSKGKPR